MTTQIAIRVDDGELAALDREVVEGRAANRSEAVRREIARLQREQRYRHEEATLLDLARRGEPVYPGPGRRTRSSSSPLGLMHAIAWVQLDKPRPALILTRKSKLHLLTWVTVAPITSTIRGITSEVSVGPRNRLDQDSVVSCDNMTTVRRSVVGDKIGLLFDDQEPALSRAISDAFELELSQLPRNQPGRE